MHDGARPQGGNSGSFVERQSRRPLVAGAFLVLTILVFAWTVFDVWSKGRQTRDQNELVASVQRLVSTVTTIQSAHRGYVISGDESFLAPYRTAIQTFPDDLVVLQDVQARSGPPSDAFSAVLQYAKEQVAFAADGIDQRRADGFETAAETVRQGDGKRIMDALRDRAREVIAEANGEIARIAAETRRTSVIQAIAFATMVALALWMSLLAWRRQKESRATTELMEGLLENAPVAIGFLDASLRPFRSNAAFDAIARDSAGVPLWAVDDGARAAIEPLLRSVIAQGRTHSSLDIDLFADRPDAERRSLILNAFPVTLQDPGRERGVGLVLIETTRRKQAERRLRHTELRFRSLVEASTSIVWAAPPNGRFSAPQPGWMEFTGQSADEHLGTGWIEAVHPDDREMTMRLWSAALAERKVYNVQHRLRRHDGEWRAMSVRAVPILDDAGEVSEWVGTHTDVTDLKAMQQKLGETGAQFETLADNIPQLAWMADPDGSIFWYNKRWFDYTGKTLEEMRGRGWRDVQHPDHGKRVEDNFDRSLSDGDVWEDTFPLRGADGTFRWFLSQATPIRDTDGQIVRWFGTNTDVTRQRAVEQELEAAKEAAENANRAKSQFIANMSHELRTPLSAVIGYAEMLEEEVEDLGEAHLLADLKKIEGNARHLLSLINDVLDLSKIEAERMDLYAETFAVEDVAREVASTVGSLLDKKNNELVLDLGANLGSAHTDQVKLRQCLINLLSNASKFTENGKVTLKARRAPDDGRDWLTFEVSDTGIGMTPEQVEKLFQRFTQADASTTRKFGGTGLGLAITKAFCGLLGGDIGVRSHEGEGSIFTIRIPADVAEPKVDEEIKHLPDGSKGQSAGLVLAIDDDPNARELVTRFLSREGFAVRTASDGVSGLEMARAIRPNVIILDVTMPRMDGWAVLTELKADPVLAGIPVVMITVIDEHNLGYALGASDYLLKPVEWDRLKRVMSRYRADADALVLAIDDDADTLARFSTMMMRENLPVVTAPNGRIGLERVAERIPTLILLDLVMPVMNGFEFLQALRANPEWRTIPVVVLTSKDLTADEWRRLQSDADQILSKGEVALKDLAAEIRVIVERGEVGDPPIPSLRAPDQEVEPLS
ncbi:response regulator [Aurantimonas sp. Leaf443]|uniref:response regulator n=1 Tax=Aurantimonas sp. Leaf443 TaxID=1736378 RepID=UPI0006F628A7|nr:response regulator [Aurantimonas sp. Leaf443]KQT83800.1 hypothetical protein ASG48_10355 [Aurantimonas sp. Leaf443]